ncbi:hypothetical protein L195_g013992 [Trifolium pratense]|uniref:Uncharacterized protein n=1 Tax=Trifolium pratense TaxID=57577 RepID=A0A2K3PPN0_TRIPR|nr:hypothetical protein L195_g013992 [Trifolium pratense]
MFPLKRKLSFINTLVLVLPLLCSMEPVVGPPLSRRLSIQGAGRTLHRTISSDTTVGSRGLKNN